ncbi:polymer-forming cytoskeletal protein [Pedobacter sp. FW305-3-2-15-E-R2A2]|uniref:polymer-forming cytoskeletal protein n=1 Tax=Pedobacter sp. FW305-3-2-15-E-R2A2 TaxID=3140251 RepID=UPI0031407E59
MYFFSLVPIGEVINRYPFLKQYEGFNLYDDWNEEDYFLLATGDVQISGHFYLDVFEEEIKKWLYKTLTAKPRNVEARIEGILIDGNLHCEGCVINKEGDYGPFVYVSGNVTCQSMLLGGAYVIVNGNVSATEVVMTDYNHGHFACEGTVYAPVFIANDHNTYVKQSINELFYYNDRAADHPEENNCYEDEATEESFFSRELARHLDNPLSQTFEELLMDLENGEFVLKGQTGTLKDAAYWKKKTIQNYRNLKRVPAVYKTEDLCLQVLQKSFYALPFVPEEYITAALCKELVVKDGFAIRAIPERWISPELCMQAALAGTMLQFIPAQFISEEIIITVFSNSRTQPDINEVPAAFITEDLLVRYVMLGKGLWLDKACTENGLSKIGVIKKVIDAGISHIDTIFANHCSREAFDYAQLLYNKPAYQSEWDKYMNTYRNKLGRIGVVV